MTKEQAMYFLAGVGLGMNMDEDSGEPVTDQLLVRFELSLDEVNALIESIARELISVPKTNDYEQ